MHQGKLLFCDTPANLKSSFGKGVLSVTSSEPRRLRTELEHARVFQAWFLPATVFTLWLTMPSGAFPSLKRGSRAPA